MGKKKNSKDRLNTLNQEYIDDCNEILQLYEKTKNTKLQMINEVLDQYREQEDRDTLLCDARKYHFSEEKTKRIEEIFQNDKFNQDNITYNVIEDIIDVRIFIDERERKEKPGFLTSIGSIIPESKNNRN